MTILLLVPPRSCRPSHLFRRLTVVNCKPSWIGRFGVGLISRELGKDFVLLSTSLRKCFIGLPPVTLNHREPPNYCWFAQLRQKCARSLRDCLVASGCHIRIQI